MIIFLKIIKIKSNNKLFKKINFVIKLLMICFITCDRFKLIVFLIYGFLLNY
jgi:hypothetical protein